MTNPDDCSDQLEREELLNAIEEMIEDGDVDDALMWCETHLARFPDDPEAFILKGHAVAERGDFELALSLYQQARALVPDWEDAALTCAGVLLELNQIDDARTLLQELVTKHPDDPHVHYTLAIAYDIQGNEIGAHRHYVEAERLGAHYHIPYRISDSAFLAMAKAVISSLPKAIKAVLKNLVMTVKDIPNDSMVDGNARRLSPLTLGFFSGTPLPARSTDDPQADFPCHIILFKKNLERVSSNRLELKEQIEITLKHEVAHYIGFDEAAVEQMGLG